MTAMGPTNYDKSIYIKKSGGEIVHMFVLVRESVTLKQFILWRGG